MTSGSTFPQRLTKIDDLARPDHYYLTAGDDCYFLGEYTARKGYAFSPTNQLILNFKKLVNARGTAQWKYKDQAIGKAAAAFRAALPDDWLNTATLVPIPPSKAPADPLYDDRLLRMLRAIRPKPAPDIRELLVQRTNMTAVHAQESRPMPDDIAANYLVDEQLRNPAPKIIAVFDDVLAAGTHFRAASSVLQRAYPAVRIIGLFIARRVPEAVEWDEIDL